VTRLRLQGNGGEDQYNRLRTEDDALRNTHKILQHTFHTRVEAMNTTRQVHLIAVQKLQNVVLSKVHPSKIDEDIMWQSLRAYVEWVLTVLEPIDAPPCSEEALHSDQPMSHDDHYRMYGDYRCMLQSYNLLVQQYAELERTVPPATSVRCGNNWQGGAQDRFDMLLAQHTTLQHEHIQLQYENTAVMEGMQSSACVHREKVMKMRSDILVRGVSAREVARKFIQWYICAAHGYSEQVPGPNQEIHYM
jgi:hypothetical protein